MCPIPLTCGVRFVRFQAIAARERANRCRTPYRERIAEVWQALLAKAEKDLAT